MSRTDIGNASREPSVYFQATLDGFLEKKSSGVLRSKTKVKCWTQGSTLYEQKDQDLKFIDVSEALIVRKVTNDPLGVQFEIIFKKKTHTYICSSSEDCKTWVAGLQKCMMLKRSRHPNSQSMFYAEDDPSVYSTIDPEISTTSSSSSNTTHVKDDKDYSRPYDAVEVESNISNDYEDVTVTMRKSSIIENGHSNSVGEASSYGDNDYTDCTSASDTYTYSNVNKKAVETIDGLELLTAAFKDCDFSVDDLPHTLNSEDISCLKILKHYLRDNKMYCTSSTLSSPDAVDPFAALRTCLASLNLN